MSKGIKKLIVDLFMKNIFFLDFFQFCIIKNKLKTISLKDLIKNKLKRITVTSPFSAEGSSHWMTMVVELKGRTRTLRGAEPGSRNLKLII
jgi:hypothetical protein